MHYKSHQTTQRKVTPTDADLAIIEQFALAGEPIVPEDLFIGRMSLANDQYDRSHERFPESYLAQFAATIPGKSVMTGHDYSRDPAGRMFKAEVTPSLPTGKELVVSYYLLASEPLAGKVKAGIARDVSIGFNPDIRLCDLCEKDYDGWMKSEENGCSHVAGREYEGKLARVTYGGNIEKVEGLEGSFVWLGCQYGAQAIAAMRAFSPHAKAAYFDGENGRGVWSLNPSADSPLFSLPQTPLHSGLIAAKEASVKDIKTDAPPPEPTLTAEQERLIALGKAYISSMQAHVKSRYAPCGQEKTGEVIAGMFVTAALEEIETAVKAADEVFNEKFPGTGKGVPLADQPAAAPPQRFNPFRSAMAGRS